MLSTRKKFDIKDIGSAKLYKNDNEYLNDLQMVLENSYGVELKGKKLNEAGSNLDRLFTSLL